MHEAPAGAEIDLTRQREVLDAYLAASRGGDFDALLAVLDPDVVLRADKVAVSMGASGAVRGAPAVAQQALAHRAAFARPAMVNGSVGLVITPRGRLRMVIDLTIVDDMITEIDVIAEAPTASAASIWRSSTTDRLVAIRPCGARRGRVVRGAPCSRRQ